MTTPSTIDDILWTTHKKPGSEALRQGVVAAFAFVAAADGRAGPAERITFHARVASSKIFAHDGADALFADYDALVATLVAGDEGRAEVERRLVRCQDVASRAVVLAAARTALVADGEDNEREEVALQHIARLIGAPPNEA